MDVRPFDQEHVLQGDAELLRLAELLSMGAATGRQIADLRGRDRDEIYALSMQAEAIAAALRKMCGQSPGESSVN